MFRIFKKKTPLQKLQELYEKLTKEAYELSHSNRKLGDEKLAEAEKVMQEIEKMKTGLI
mgnify:CR=1 FL=1